MHYFLYIEEIHAENYLNYYSYFVMKKNNKKIMSPSIDDRKIR